MRNELNFWTMVNVFISLSDFIKIQQLNGWFYISILVANGTHC